jgi:AraC-like DNA-binding protein
LRPDAPAGVGGRIRIRGVNGPSSSSTPVALAWQLARSGEFRDAIATARSALDTLPPDSAAERVELHLACASCAMRQGDQASALRDLDAAAANAAQPGASANFAQRVDAWRAELAYFQGRYSDGLALVDRLLPLFERDGDAAYAAFSLRVRMAILLARGDYDGIHAVGEGAVALARASRDGYIEVQVQNVLGAAHFDRATSKLRAPHARAHLSALDPTDTVPMEEDARAALRCFEHARAAAQRSGNAFAAWYVAGNIERIQILLGNAKQAIPAIRKRLRALQVRGARYDEIVTRSNLAWGLRLLGRHREALHELDVALKLVRTTGTGNVMLEYLEYDRSIVLDALGDAAGARTSYRRYLQLVGAYNRVAHAGSAGIPGGVPKRPLEPWFLKRADRFVAGRLAEAVSVQQIAAHCGVSGRTLEKAFRDFRATTPVAHVRNLRLDLAQEALREGAASVADVAHACGFRSATTFALEYRKRFGTSPSRARRTSG